MKKILSLVLSTIMTMSIIATTAFAADNFEVAANDVTATEGASTVTVTVSLKNNPGFKSFSTYVEYDPSVLEYKASKKSEYKILGDFGDFDMTLTKPNTTLNPFILYAYSADAITGDGDFIDLVFYIKDGAKGGKYPITLTAGPNSTVGEDGKTPLAVTYTSGSVTIPGAVEEEVKTAIDTDYPEVTKDGIRAIGTSGTVTVPAGKSFSKIDFTFENSKGETGSYTWDFGTSISATTTYGLNIYNVPADVTSITCTSAEAK